MPEPPNPLKTREPDYHGFWFSRMQRQMALSIVVTTPISWCLFILFSVALFLIPVIFEGNIYLYIAVMLFGTFLCILCLVVFFVPVSIIGILYDWGPGGACQLCFALPCAMCWAVFAGWFLVDRFDYVPATVLVCGLVVFCIFTCLLGVGFTIASPWVTMGRRYAMDSALEAADQDELHPAILFFLPSTTQSLGDPEYGDD